MMSFKNLPLIAKILALLLLLAVFSVAATVLSTTKMKSIDGAYSSALSGPVRATIALSRSNRSLVQFNQGVYQSLSATTDADNNAAIATQKTAVETFHKRLADSLQLDPSHADEVNALLKRFDDFVGVTCKSVVDAANASSDAAQNLKISADWNAQCMPISSTLTAIFPRRSTAA